MVGAVVNGGGWTAGEGCFDLGSVGLGVGDAESIVAAEKIGTAPKELNEDCGGSANLSMFSFKCKVGAPSFSCEAQVGVNEAFGGALSSI